MKLQQLRYALEVYQQNLNVSEAAEVLFTSQPGISKQIKLLEEEIGVAIFVRQGKRLVAVTEPGKMVLAIADRILRDTQNIQKIGDDFAQKDTGKLTVAGVDCWIKLKFNQIFQQFAQNFPAVQLCLKTGSPRTIRTLLENGDADIGISTGEKEHYPELHCLPFDAVQYRLLVRKNHQLADKENISLYDLSHYPILAEEIMCDELSPLTQSFIVSGLEMPEMIMSSSDSFQIAQLVQQKFGIGIVSHYFQNNNNELIMRDLSHLLPDISLNIL
ncbi:MAG: LysR family transcriptional regulator, partial [Neisseriaceae bacterium]|nr:LysR family transcriptional regulator [Neisseriaceae bacterium]